MFGISQQSRSIARDKKAAHEALRALNILDSYFGVDFTYQRNGATIIMSGDYLYSVSPDGKLTQLYHYDEDAEWEDTGNPQVFASLLDELFNQLAPPETKGLTHGK